MENSKIKIFHEFVAPTKARVRVEHPHGSHESWDVSLLHGDIRLEDIVLFSKEIELGGEWNTTALLLVLIDGQVILTWEICENGRVFLAYQETRIPFAHQWVRTVESQDDRLILRFSSGDLELSFRPDTGSPLRVQIRNVPDRVILGGFKPLVSETPKRASRKTRRHE